MISTQFCRHFSSQDCNVKTHSSRLEKSELLYLKKISKARIAWEIPPSFCPPPAFWPTWLVVVGGLKAKVNCYYLRMSETQK